jgi:hypothetical protein
MEVDMGLSSFSRKEKPPVGSRDKGGKPEPVDAPQLCFVLCRAAEAGDLSNANEIVARVFGRGYSAGAGKEDFQWTNQIHEAKKSKDSPVSTNKRKGPGKVRPHRSAHRTTRNKPVHIPLRFDQAVEGLVNVKSKAARHR